MSSFIIPALNTGNVTQQRLQGNQNAQAVQSLQAQVTALQATPSAVNATQAIYLPAGGDRALGITYTNSASSSILVTVTGVTTLGVGNTSTIAALVGVSAASIALVCGGSITNSSGYAAITFIVPAGYFYRVNTGSIQPGDDSPANLLCWTEWTL